MIYRDVCVFGGDKLGAVVGRTSPCGMVWTQWDSIVG